MSSNIINATAEAKLNGAVRNRAVASAGFLRKGHTHNARDSWPTSTRFGSILIFIAALCSPRTKMESTVLCPRSLMFSKYMVEVCDLVELRDRLSGVLDIESGKSESGKSKGFLGSRGYWDSVYQE